MGVTSTASRLTATFGTARNPGTRSYGPEAVQLLAEAGLELFGWQAMVLEEWLEVDDRERLTRPTACLVAPRRNGKSHLIAARVLAGMLWLGERRVTYTAHEQASARELFDLMRELLSHPRLSPLVKKTYLGHGLEEILLENGASFRFRTRTGHGGRGSETDLLILDEALILDDAILSALTPLTARAAAGGRGQVIYASSAGSNDELSATLLALRDRGRELNGEPGGGYAFHEWSSARGDDPTDPATWSKANPSLGTGILDESFLSEARGRLSVEAFAREHLGIWTDSADLPVIDPARWAELALEEQPDLEPSRWVTFDLAPDRRAARVLGFGKATDGRLVVSVLDSIDDPLGIDGELYAQRVVGIVTNFDPDLIGFDRLTGAHVEQVLAGQGWKTRLRPLTGAKFSNGLASLDAAVRLGTLAHDGHVDLEDDLGRAVGKPFGDGGLIFSRKSVSSGSIAGAVALAGGVFLATDELTL